MPPLNTFTAVVEANAYYPWSHATSIFCKCANCNSFRQARILDKCERFASALAIMTGDDQLEWDHPARELPPVGDSITPTTFARPSFSKSHVRATGAESRQTDAR